ncbi:MAG: hypothetical protein AB4060_16460 [Crocosphaera sp.]
MFKTLETKIKRLAYSNPKLLFFGINYCNRQAVINVMGITIDKLIINHAKLQLRNTVINC